LTEIPETLLENQMLISGMLVHKLEIPEFSKFLHCFPNVFEQKLPPEPKWRFLDHFSASSLDLFRRMLKEEI
jgi:hypothetical protein